MNRKIMLKKLVILLPVLVGIILVGVLIWRGQTSQSAIAESYEKYLEEGDQFYQEREYSQAYARYQKAIEKDPTRADAYYGINFILLDKGLNENAVELMLSAEKNLPKKEVSQLYLQIADEYFHQLDWENSLLYYNESLAFDSSNEKAKVGLFLTYLKNGQISDAFNLQSEIPESKETKMLDKYDELLNEESKDLYVIVDNARVFVNEGYSHLAIEPILSVGEDASEYWDAWYVLGKAYYEIGDSTNAVDSLEKALILGSEEPGLYLILARVSYEQNQINSSYSYYDRALNFATGEFREVVGEEYSSVLLSEEAYVNALTVAELSFDESLQYESLMWRDLVRLQVYIAKEETDNFTELISSASDELKSDREYLILVADYYLDSEDVANAEPIIGSIKGFDQYDPYYYLYQARLNLLNENLDDALLNLEKSIEYDLAGETTPEAKILINQIAP